MKTWASPVAGSATILCLVAAVLLTGCAGVSTGAGTSQPSPPPPPSNHSVFLSWNPSATPDISGYNIYRAEYTSSCGRFSKINSQPNLDTSYTDSTVANGTSYCYAATAIDASNRESALSEVVSDIQIPSS